MLAVLLLATPTSDLFTQRFSLDAIVSARLYLPEEGRQYDGLLGNIDVKFTGIESVLFSVDEGTGHYDPRVLFEFDVSDHLVRQVTYGFGGVGGVDTEETRSYEHDRIVTQKFSHAYESTETVNNFAYDDAGRLKSAHCTVDKVATRSEDCTYLPGGEAIVRTTEFEHGATTKQSTLRIESNAAGYVTREWKLEEGKSDSLVGRYEYDEKGRLKVAAWVNTYSNEHFTDKFTYSDTAPYWSTRNTEGPDGRQVSSVISFFAASGAILRSESWDYSWAGLAKDVSTPEVTSDRAAEYDEQGWLVKYSQKMATSKSAEDSIRLLERDEKGSVIGWKSFYVSGTPAVVMPGNHVRLELKYRTMPR